MKKISKLIALILALSMVLASCGSKGDETSKEGEKDSSLEYIQSRKKLILGLDASFPPMGFKDDDNNIVGFDIDLAKEVCKRMGVELVLQPVDWDSKEMELGNKNIDCIWNGLSYSDKRDEEMTLSQSYMGNTQVGVVLADSDIKSLEDMKDKVVAVQSGSTASEAMDEHKEIKDSLKELLKIDDNVQAMMDLEIGGSDAVVMDEVVARYYMEKNKGKYKLLDDSLADEKYVIGFRKGDKALCDEVEKQLKAMKEDGTLAQISTTWFGSDVTTIK